MTTAGESTHLSFTKFYLLLFSCLVMSSCLQTRGMQHIRLHYFRSLLKAMSLELLMPSNYFIFCCPLLLLPSIFPIIRVFSNESALCIRWPQYQSFSYSISPSKEYSGLIFFRMDWLHLLAVQGTLKSLLQHHRSKASILWCSAFFMFQFFCLFVFCFVFIYFYQLEANYFTILQWFLS